MKAINMRPEKNIVGMFVGKAGSGKSSAIASMAEAGPLQFMDFDKRINGIFHTFSYLKPGTRENIEYTQYKFAEGFKATFSDIVKWAEESVLRKCKYKTVALESAGTMCSMFVDEYSRLTDTGIRKVGIVDMTGPSHYNYAYRAFHKMVYQGLREFKNTHVIVSCWTMDRWGKPENAEQYAPNEIIGTKLNLTDKISEEIPGYFDEIYEFEKFMVGAIPSFKVRFRSTIAKTAFPSLPNGWVDITGKSFYHVWKSYVDKETEKSLEEVPE